MELVKQLIDRYGNKHAIAMINVSSGAISTEKKCDNLQVSAE